MSVNDIDLESATLEAAVEAVRGAPRGYVKIGVAKPLPSSIIEEQREVFVLILVQLLLHTSLINLHTFANKRITQRVLHSFCSNSHPKHILHELQV